MQLLRLRRFALIGTVVGYIGPLGTMFGAAPVFTSQPSTVATGVGTTAAFNATANNGANYQWQISFSGTIWVPIDNFIWSAGTADTQFLTLPQVPLILNGAYVRCLAYNGSGFSLSNQASLTVSANSSTQISLMLDPGGRFLVPQLPNPIPAIPPQGSYSCLSPPFHEPVLLGSTPSEVTFTLGYSGGSGGGYTVQWYLSTDGGTTWNPIPSGGHYLISQDLAQTIYVPAPISADNQNLFRAVATDKMNGSSITTNPARLDVTDPIVSNSDINGDGLNNGSTTAKVATSASFRVTASGSSALSYEWYLSTDFGTTWTDTGMTNYVLYVPVTSMTQNQNMFRCVVTDSAGSTNSDPMLLTTTP